MNANFSCLNIDQKIKYICSCDYKYFFNKANVQGVGLSYKIKNGFNTYKKCIQVCVSKKIPMVNIKSKDIIPKYYKGIETDVIESGFFLTKSLTNRVRPAPGGYDVGLITTKFGGTYGCLVTDGTDYFLLSNSHIIGMDGDIGTPVLQPSVRFGGVDSKNIIGALSKFIPLKSKTSSTCPQNSVDCAIAKVGNKSLVSRKIQFLGRIKSISTGKLSMDIQKVGSISELTKGQITALNFSCTMFNDGKPYFMVNQIQTTKILSHGDSGALLVDTKVNVLGLLCGGSDSFSIANEITNVLDSLNVSLVK